MAADRGHSAYIRRGLQAPPASNRRLRRRGRMGRRGQVVMRRIEDRRRRGICFRKRLAGMEKKASELAVLCDAEVGFLVLPRDSAADGRFHHFAAPTTMENIIQRYENSLAAEKGVYRGDILEKSKHNAFHVPDETTDEGSNIGDMWSIDETDISRLDIDQLSQIEGLLEDVLRWTSARKTQLEASSIATLQRKGKAAIAERSFMEIASGQAFGHMLTSLTEERGENRGNLLPRWHSDNVSACTQKQVAVGGGQQSGEGVDLALGLSLSVGGAGGEQYVHRTPAIDLNVP